MDWEKYWSQKGVQLAITLAAAGLAEVASSIGLIGAANEIKSTADFVKTLTLTLTVMKGIDLAVDYTAFVPAR